MATSRITVRTIDYHKYRSLVVERNGAVREELRERCDHDVTALCTAVRCLYDRDEYFDDVDDGSGTGRAGRDFARFGEICGWYKLILENRRVRSVDVRLRSGWWQGKTVEKAASAGRLRSASLRETLVDKTVNWLCRHDTACWRGVPVTDSEVSRRLDGPGVAVFLHRDRRCFRLVARASSVLSWCSDALRDAFEDGDELLRVLENDTMLKHDSVWPYGINFRLHVTSFVELVQLRNSCRRHRWPMSRDADIDDGDVTQVQGRLCRRLRLGMNGIADDVVTGDNEFDVLQSLPDSPTSASAMLTFADIVAASTVKTWSDFPGRGRSKCQHPDDSSSSSDGSTVTATTVRTVVTKPVGVQQEDPVNCTGTATESPATRRQLASSTPRSASRPASSRVRQLTSAPTPRARSISQSRSTTNASNSVPAAGPRNVKTRLPHLNRQFQK